jgi:hypothetical protein
MEYYYKSLAENWERTAKELAQQNWDLIQRIQEIEQKNYELQQQLPDQLDEAC